MTAEETIRHILLFLPLEGLKSRRAFALFCAERVKHFSSDLRVTECLAVVRRKVIDPDSVTADELRAAAAGAYVVADGAYAAGAPAAAFDAALSAAYAAGDYAVYVAGVAGAAYYAYGASYHASYSTVVINCTLERCIQLTHLLSLASICWTFVGLVHVPSMRKVI